MESYGAIYMLGNLFMAFVIYKYVHVFYSCCKMKAAFERTAYIGYFMLITATHIFFKLPIIVMLVNIVLLLLLTLMYEGTIKKCVLSAAIIYFSLMVVETSLAFLTSYLNLNLLKPFAYESEFGIIVIRIVSFILVLLVQGFKSVKSNAALPNAYWISLLAVPLGTVIMLFTIFMSSNISRILMLVCMGCALLINMLTFYLYDAISALLVEKTNQRVAAAQNSLYEHEVQMMKASLDDFKVLQHDLKNKLSPLYGLAQAGQYEEVLKQLSELTSSYSKNREFVKSGNITIDCIINYKLHQAEKQKILISANVLIPDELSLPTLDIAVILGNLLDNALEAVIHVNDRWIDIKLNYTKGRLIIKINNAYDGELIKTAGGFVTRKKDKADHGLGIKSVQAVLDKYDGAMQFSYDASKFEVKALLYI